METFAKHLETHFVQGAKEACPRQSMHCWVCITFYEVQHGGSVTIPEYYSYYITILFEQLATLYTQSANQNSIIMRIVREYFTDIVHSC